jgi:hypothetical protein
MRRVCKRCGKALPKLAIIEHDRYCSTACCRAAHGVVSDFSKERVDPRTYRRSA